MWRTVWFVVVGGLIACSCGSESSSSSSPDSRPDPLERVAGSSTVPTSPPLSPGVSTDGAGSTPAPSTTASPDSVGTPSVVERGELAGGVFLGETEPTASVVWEQLVVSSPGPSTRSAVVADATDELVVAGTGEGTVVAITAGDGEVLWSVDLTRDTALEEYNSYAMYPTIAGDVVFVAASTGALISLDTETGEALWESKIGGLFGGFPVVVDDTVIVTRSIADLYDDMVDYAGSDDGFLGGVVAVNASTGETRWEMSTPLWSSAVAGPDGTIIVTSFDNQFVGNGAVTTLDAPTGDVIWTVDDLDVGTPAAVSADLVVVAAGQLVALDSDGGELWRTSSDWCSCTFQFPAIVDHTVVVVTNEAAVYGLDARSGRTCWAVDIGDNYGIVSTHGDGIAAVATGGAAGWIHAATGSVTAILPIPAQALSIIPTTQGPIVAASDGYVRLVDPSFSTGAPTGDASTTSCDR